MVLAGDFNAKINLNQTMNGITQTESRNGKLLKQLITTTGCTAANINKDTKWTRENRKKVNEKSVIDYILTNNDNLIEKLTVDVDGTARPKGRKDTDHNTIIFKIQINKEKQITKTKKSWRKGDESAWENYSKTLEDINHIDPPKNYEDLVDQITYALHKNIGMKNINSNNKRKEHKDVKQARKNKKEAKKRYKEAIQEKNGRKIKEKLTDLKNRQHELRELIENQYKAQTTELLETIIKEGGTSSNSFWKTRRRILNNKEDNNYDIIKPDGTIITNTEEEKQHIADFFEDLYQARPTIEGYQKKTEEIQNNIKKNLSSEQFNPTKITLEEIKRNIQILKKNKAVGPDNIPNEALIYMSNHTLNHITDQFNNILISEKIPTSWKSGNIIRIYKGKGTKGMMTNERGITLSSNIGKLFERIINNRVSENVTISDNQGGGKKASSTADYNLILQETIRKNKNNKKPTYITFLDVTKAYDKAWIDALLNALKNKGATNNDLRIIHNLNSNLTARVDTRHGLTREIKIKDSIRQGGVLSVLQYATMMDELAEITLNDIGTTKSTNPIILLWMDDVAIVTDNIEDQTKILNKLNHSANAYRVIFGEEKSKIMSIGKPGLTPNIHIKMDNITINQCNDYKYLGTTINDKLNYQTHTTQIKGKTEAAYQTIMQVAYDSNLRNIQMSIIWKLVECTIIPIITYGCESVDLNKKELSNINKILMDILKRILLLPTSTPNEGIYHELGMTDIENTITQRKLGYYANINFTENKHLKEILNDLTPGSWTSKINAIIKDLNLNKINIINKKRWKRLTKDKVEKQFITELKGNAQNKSKLQNLIKNSDWNKLKRKDYLNKLTRTQCHYIISARLRMLKVKDNYKNQYNNPICRGCGLTNETQSHILEKCNKLHENNTNIVHTMDIFSENTKELGSTANKIRITLEKLEEINNKQNQQEQQPNQPTSNDVPG